MDARARTAVSAAINKAKVCKTPIAKYDNEAKKPYLEYSDGKRFMETKKPLLVVFTGPNGSGYCKIFMNE